MKNILILILVLVGVSTTVYGGGKVTKDTARTVAQSTDEEPEIDCKKNNGSTYELNYCAALRVDEMSKRLDGRILQKCLKSPTVLSVKGGTAEPGAINDCQAEMYEKLRKAAWHMFPQ